MSKSTREFIIFLSNVKDILLVNMFEHAPVFLTVKLMLPGLEIGFIYYDVLLDRNRT